MLPTYYGYFLFAILISFAQSSVGLSISLKQFNQRNKVGQAIHERKTFRDPGVKNIIDLIDVPEFVSFAILQVHALETKLELYQNNFRDCHGKFCSLYGSHLGLVAVFDKKRSARFVLLTGKDEPVDVLISVVAYDENAPIPGGCDMEFKPGNAVWQEVISTNETVAIDAQLALAPISSKLPCGSPSLKLQHYRMFLPERDFEQETYFDAIQKMTTVQDILENGQEILPALSTSSARRVFSAYPGTGSAYAMIATYGNYSSAYVPVVSYACRPLSDPSSCGNHDTIIVQALCAIISIIAVIVTFVGHKSPKLQIIFLGAISSGLAAFVVLYGSRLFQTSTVLGIVMALSFLGGIWSFLLYSPTNTSLRRRLPAQLTLGFLVASTIYHSLAGESPLFENDCIFWFILASIMLLVVGILGLLPFDSNNVCCAILGPYTIIFSIDVASGSYLKYIVINTVRRGTISGFNVAVMRPPFQIADNNIFAFGLLVCLIGLIIRTREAFDNLDKKAKCSVDTQTTVTTSSIVKVDPEPVTEKC